MAKRKEETFVWSHEKDELLIELVKGKNLLFDLSSPLYNNNIAKRKAWNEIGKHLEIEGVLCKDRWEQLRSQHRKHLKKIKTKSGRSASSLLKWKYQDQMDFLKPFMKDSKRLYSTLNDDDSISNDEDEGGCTQEWLQDGEGNDMVSQQNAGSEDEVQGSDENTDEVNNDTQRNGVYVLQGVSTTPTESHRAKVYCCSIVDVNDRDRILAIPASYKYLVPKLPRVSDLVVSTLSTAAGFGISTASYYPFVLYALTLMCNSRGKERFGNQINLYKDRGLNLGPPAQKSDTLSLDRQRHSTTRHCDDQPLLIQVLSSNHTLKRTMLYFNGLQINIAADKPRSNIERTKRSEPFSPLHRSLRPPEQPKRTYGGASRRNPY
uniref:MADF domain-containing protein n=1 Tax=Timema tahoe TaxID=61484 RepID=A0A7R9II31_9NEOP|nr:unnamed protein product [Timema tahoe]